MRVTLFVLIILSSFYTFSKECSGFYITLNNDTVRTTIKLPIESMGEYMGGMVQPQYGVICLNDSGSLLHLTPEMAKEVVIFYSPGDTIRMMPIKKSPEFLFENFGKKCVFLRIQIDGSLKLYQGFTPDRPSGSVDQTVMNGAILGGAIGGAIAGAFVYGVPSNGGSNGRRVMILQKGNGDLVEIKMIRFKSNISEYLSDCPVLGQRVFDMDYKYDDLPQVVSEYNRDCGFHSGSSDLQKY